ncbi:MAG: tryptophan-rich sensory protein [Methanocorpusculum parvum]|nr:tryptophan-rich sensory protein [Methanocorpusculum parvum]
MQTEKIKPFVLPVIIGVLICLAAGMLGSLVTMPAVESMWFIDLNKPVFQPPNWLFAPVWTILYILMGVAAGIVFVKSKDHMMKKTALILFAVQLVLNILWSFLFFGAQMLLGAAVDIVLLWAVLLTTTISFFKVSRAAGWMMIPYILWVTFATILTITLFVMN